MCGASTYKTGFCWFCSCPATGPKIPIVPISGSMEHVTIRTGWSDLIILREHGSASSTDVLAKIKRHCRHYRNRIIHAVRVMETPHPKHAKVCRCSRSALVRFRAAHRRVNHRLIERRTERRLNQVPASELLRHPSTCLLLEDHTNRVAVLRLRENRVFLSSREHEVCTRQP
jgi:hypothetical protein